MRIQRVRQGVVGLASVAVFGLLVLLLRPGQETSVGQAVPLKAKARPAGAAVAMPANLVSVLLTLGLKDQKATDWKGDVAVSEGRIISVEVVQGKGQADGNKFTARSAVTKKAEKKKATPTRPKVRVNLETTLAASLEVNLDQGKFKVKLADLPLGSAAKFLDGQVSVEREEGAVRLTDAETEDDYPALARAPDGTLWLAYNEFQKGPPLVTERVLAGNFDDLVPTGHGDQVRLKHFDGKSWSPCLDVTEPGLDIWRPTITVDKAGVVHLAWSQNVDGNYDIYHRSYTPAGGKWSEISRISKDPGSDFHVVAATDAGGIVWLAWQGFRKGHFHILTSRLEAGKWSEPFAITSAKANHWTPAIATDRKGTVYIAYDTYENENYDVRLYIIKDGVGKTMDIAASARFEARPSIVCDAQDRLWIAYEEGDEQWGKDYSTNMFRKIGFEENPGFALYIDRTIKVKCLVDGKLMQPAEDLAQATKGKLDLNKSLPRLAADGAGGVWLTFRHHPLALGTGEVWNSYVLHFDGAHWSAPRRLPYSANLLDNRPALAAYDKGMVVVYSGDRRTKTQDRDQNDLYTTLLLPTSSVGRISNPSEKKDGLEIRPTVKGQPQLKADAPSPKGQMKSVHKDEVAQVARMRDYRIDNQGKKLQLLRGEFHRHTEYTAHRDQDGLMEDAWRYSVDASHMDWMGDGDHDNGYHHIYMWWQIQKLTDLMFNPPAFIGVHSYERSNVYPNGHRNVIMPKRGIRPLPRGNLAGTEDKGTPDTKMLYAYLKHFGGMCSSHTSGTNMGTDWRDNDPVVEPVVEIYQGHRHNYEHFGAPRSATKETNIGGYEPKGFVWNAFAKGYKMGFQASSDHVSTHMSYAVALTDDFSRPGIIAAFKKRHSYAATDNIIMDVRCEKHMQGDIFETAQKPTLDIKVVGSAPIAKISVIRDSKYVYTDTPKKAELELHWTDMDPTPGKSVYYYVRIEQTDGNLAWASPMWITYRGK